MKLLHLNWEQLRRAFSVLAIIRFSILIPFVLIVTLIAADQLGDALLAASERVSSVSTLAFLGATVFAALVVWYSARTMLRFRFAHNPASEAKVYPGLKRQLPRLLAILVPAALLGKVVTLQSPLSGANGRNELAVALGVVLLLTGLYVYARRNIAQLPYLAVLAESEAQERRDLTRLSALPPTTRRVLLGLAIADLLGLAFAICGPLYRLGSPALLLLAFGMIGVAGSALVYLANHRNVPVLTMLLVWVIVCSPWNDNHAVRQTAASHSHGFLSRSDPIAPIELLPSPLPTANIADYFHEWWGELDRLEPGPLPLTVVVVAADGGGIRAAYWTAAVLGQLADSSPKARVPFARHVFAISGVSGGSLGAATFAAIAAHRTGGSGEQRSWVAEADAVLGRDFLSPTLANALFPDLLQRFLPVPVFDDRAIALEQSWERAWSEAHPNDPARFGAPFHDLWSMSPHSIPLLFLNGTVVETGDRAVMDPLATAPYGVKRSETSPYEYEPFGSVLRLGQKLGTQLPLSTAVLLSARFTYVSPAGLIGTNPPDRSLRGRIVDGGYFDNSGGTTAQELIDAIRLAHRSSEARQLRIILLHIRNQPGGSSTGTVTDWSKRFGGRVWLSETLSPIRTLLNAREARAGQIMGYLDRTAEARDFEFKEVSLQPDQFNPPLGWALSCAVQTQMERQLTECSGKQCASDAIRDVMQEVYGKDQTPIPTPTPPRGSAPICQ